MTAHDVRLWHTLRLRDADAMTAWLVAVGFTPHDVYRDEDDPSVVLHGQMLWGDGGGIMYGSHRETTDWSHQPGQGGAYLVTDDPDAVFARAVEAGATVVYEPREEDYGGRGAGVRDPEGNLWSFGSYQPT